MLLSNEDKKVVLITGTRPEIIKLFPIMRLLDLEDIHYTFIHTGQHHDYNLFLNFIKEFEIKKPDYSIKLENPHDSIQQFSEILSGIGHIFKECKPSSIITVGDTNSVAAAALAGSKAKIPVIHIEAGLRSYDWRMPEEYNRRMTDHISDELFAPTSESATILAKEQVQGKIYTVGNTVLDAVRLCLQSPRKSIHNNQENQNSINSIGFSNQLKQYTLLTLHREENVDNPDILKRIFNVLSHLDINCIFPVHPRTLKRIHQFGLGHHIKKNINIIDPVGYHDFLRLLRNCQFVITDSGGIQEEITSPYINKRALIFRDSTERKESITSGHSILCPLDYFTMFESIKRILSSQPILSKSPYGDGYASEKIVETLKKEPIIPLARKVISDYIQI
ncbi:MAG: UDP-N-acetylglucosamine 2-epimerase (non-hydrolyzing) [Thermoproteota archaeon]|nr:UDP-N-acetylglucosamine 2-epimerase (non-hydrolyzing) [Thermoproteota archaeon]